MYLCTLVYAKDNDLVFEPSLNSKGLAIYAHVNALESFALKPDSQD